MSPPLKLPSNRSFGFTFATVFALAGGWLYWKASPLAIPALGLAVIFAIAAWLVPRILRPLNLIWMRFGMLLNYIVSPVVMGIVFFAIFTPVALYFRIRGRDALRRTFEGDLESYWIQRTPPGPDGESLPRQF